MQQNTKRGRASPGLIFSALCFVLLIVLVCLCVSRVGTVSSVVSDPEGRASTEKVESYIFPGVDWDYWLSVNPDIVAWVSVPGTNIDHAVAQAPAHNPSYYLSHDVYQNWNPHGCPYVEADSMGLTGQSTYIFGHNMGYDNSMFADFAQYSSQRFAAEHPVVLLQTPNDYFILEVSAADIVSGYEQSRVNDFADEGTFHLWYAKRFELSDMKIKNDEASEKLITFVTCSYNYFSNERTLVYTQH